MTGIVQFGVYIPFHRLTREQIAGAWNVKKGPGEKSVASYDEDSVTLAVEAARNCIHGLEPSRVRGLFFASTTAPYMEKQSASIAAAALDLQEGIITTDLCNSLRSGSTALRLAKDCIEAGSAETILVTCSDTRTPRPGSSMEPDLGDAAVAFLLGKDNTAAIFEAFVCCTNEMHDTWRTQDEPYLHTWEDRWVKQHGLLEIAKNTALRLLTQQGLSPKDVDRAVLYAPDTGSHRALARAIGLEYSKQVQPSLIDQVGCTGTSHLPLMLAQALEECNPGDRILAVGYGDGSDAFLLRATEQIRKAKGRRGVSGYLQRKRLFQNYERYLWYRGLVDIDPPTPLLVGSSATVLWREQNQIFGLHGSRCKRCGQSAFPVQRICLHCQSKDNFDEIRLADLKGKLFTFTLDYLASQVDPPLVQSVVDMETGARIYTYMTDVDPGEITLGMEVEMTFRRIRKAEGFYNYFWKCTPVR